MSETAEPVRIVQGDSYAWSRSWTDYPASSYTATWYWYGADAVHSVAGVPNGDAFDVSLDPATTKKWAEGLYRWGIQITQGGTFSRTLTETGDTTVDLALEDRQGDPRSWAERALEQVELALERKSGRDQLSMSIQGTSISRMTHEELWEHRARLRELVAAERRERGIVSARPVPSANPVARMW